MSFISKAIDGARGLFGGGNQSTSPPSNGANHSHNGNGTHNGTHNGSSNGADHSINFSAEHFLLRFRSIEDAPIIAAQAWEAWAFGVELFSAACTAKCKTPLKESLAGALQIEKTGERELWDRCFERLLPVLEASTDKERCSQELKKLCATVELINHKEIGEGIAGSKRDRAEQAIENALESAGANKKGNEDFWRHLALNTILYGAILGVVAYRRSEDRSALLEQARARFKGRELFTVPVEVPEELPEDWHSLQ